MASLPRYCHYNGPIRPYNLMILADELEESGNDYGIFLRSDVRLNVEGPNALDEFPFPYDKAGYFVLKNKYKFPETYQCRHYTLSKPIGQWYTKVTGTAINLLYSKFVLKQWPIHHVQIYDHRIEQITKLLNSIQVEYITLIGEYRESDLRELFRKTDLRYCARFELKMSVWTNEIWNLLKNGNFRKDCILELSDLSSKKEGVK